MKYRKNTISEQEFLHVICCTHILNLIVREEFKEFKEYIAIIRNIVKYVKSPPQRWTAFSSYIQF